jgi:hypothetical protein
VLLSSRTVTRWRSLDGALAVNIGEVRARRRAAAAGTTAALNVGVLRRGGGQLAFGVAERGEPAAKHATGVDVDSLVEPLRLRRRRISLDHDGLPRFSAAQL